MNKKSNSLSLSSIKILVWNIYKGDGENFESYFNRHLENSDIMMMQEGFLNDSMIKLLGASDLDYYMSVSFLMSNDIPTGTLTASKFLSGRMINQRTVDVEPFIRSPKTNMISYFPIEGSTKELLTINIHGMNFKRDPVYLMKQIRLALPYIQAHDGPIVFAGDFNTKNSLKLKAVDDFMEENGFSKIKWDPDNRTGKILDHFYYKGLKVLKSTLYPEDAGSDHPAMWVEFSVKIED
ncbi:MAG: endonuclease/exonuclease/phosphatase family protein [Bdellovibrionales bacterium]|nr:endonuclease/exonuclease/phosphatase family protein [Bdellovibrionales bacterium]